MKGSSVVWWDRIRTFWPSGKKHKTAHHHQLTTPTVKHVGGSIMMWGCFWRLKWMLQIEGNLGGQSAAVCKWSSAWEKVYFEVEQWPEAYHGKLQVNVLKRSRRNPHRNPTEPMWLGLTATQPDRVRAVLEKKEGKKKWQTHPHRLSAGINTDIKRWTFMHSFILHFTFYCWYFSVEIWSQ